MNTDPVNHPSLQGLVRFIASQPKEAHIDHAGGWASCALGDYTRSIGTLYEYHVNRLVPSRLLVEEQSLWHGHDVLWEASDAGSRMWETYRFTTMMGWLIQPPRVTYEHGNTYGDLQQLIATMPHLQQFT